MSDGTTVHIQVTPVGGNEDVALTAVSFEGIRESMLSIAHEVGEVLTEVRPTKASVEFGLEVGIQSGQLIAFLVKGTGTATLKVTLEWDSTS
jgi:hypothetical protein